MKCVFCSISDPLLENELAIAFFDQFPVTKGHLLFGPRRHVVDYFETTLDERLAIDRLLLEAKTYIDKEYRPDGYNIGINIGEAAGQTVMHAHLHLIPRYKGDVKDPRGGVRGVIPRMRAY